MNLRDLRYLVALADHQHFSQAAAASFVSQPTLSTQIKKLEDELGVSLVERSPRRVMLTEVGRAVAERARYVLREVEEIREIARRTQDPESGSVRLGFFPTLGPYLLPHVVPKLRARFPRLELLLVEEKTPVLVQMLIEGKLDAAGLAMPLHDDRLHAEFLFEEPFVLAVPRGHELAQCGSLKVEDLADRALLLLEDGHCLREQALDVCHLAGSTERTGFRATSLETLRQMVAADVGITLLPSLAVKPPVPRSENLALVPFAGRPPSRRIALAWRRTTAMAPFLQRLAGVIAELPAALLATDAGPTETAAPAPRRRRGGA
ncbi:MAG: LysR substrate-binding domain-containing protein [Xanthomonadaceae bacterium]|jgi:LysR family hydrogen peroxide-inducible transcriptional activator|nr:LysR substrate-binding domain-containing protein [Xanthomonadaceae bacterium]